MTDVDKYIGVKLINAKPMTREAYNVLRGWTVPEDENPEDAGYLVEYIDGGKANCTGFEGYISWSPKDVFENAYRPVSGMSFGLAIEALKLGKKVARSGWNGKGMWLVYVAGDVYEVARDVLISIDAPDRTNSNFLPWIGMKTADNKFVPWLASQTDVLAEDWVVIE